MERAIPLVAAFAPPETRPRVVRAIALSDPCGWIPDAPAEETIDG